MNALAPPAPAPALAVHRGQLLGLAVPVAVLAAVAGTLAVRQPGYLDALADDPLGVKLVVAAAVLFALGLVVYLGGCALLNRFAGASHRGALTAVLGATCFVLFCLPAAFVLQAGPAAIGIRNDLQAG